MLSMYTVNLTKSGLIFVSTEVAMTFSFFVDRFHRVRGCVSSMIGMTGFSMGLLSVALFISQLGCNKSASEAPVGEKEMMAIASLLNTYYNTPPHVGIPPANQEELKTFASTSGKAILEQFKIANADALFVSSRDNQPIVVHYGSDFEKYQTIDGAIIAYESVGINGERLVAYKGGSIIPMKEADLQKVVQKK